MSKWRGILGKRGDESQKDMTSAHASGADVEANKPSRPKWTLGILADKETDEVPGSVMLMSKAAKRDEPLGLQHLPSERRPSAAGPLPYEHPSRPASRASSRSRRSSLARQKTTSDGTIILNPQPEDSVNDPLNWPPLRRDLALLSLGLFCMLGGGLTPILAAGFSNVANSFNIAQARVSLTTGLFMMGLGIGCVIMSPTAIVWGKRPVYLTGALLMIVSAVWCALSPNFPSLILARIFQGIATSPVECLPSATIAEIFFLHERAFRLGIYTLLYLGGKNLVPLVSAAIINKLSWQWVFWVVAFVAAFCAVLLFFFVPETYWDRMPRPRKVLKENDEANRSRVSVNNIFSQMAGIPAEIIDGEEKEDEFVNGHEEKVESAHGEFKSDRMPLPRHDGRDSRPTSPLSLSMMRHDESWKVEPAGQGPPTPHLHNLNSPSYDRNKQNNQDYFALAKPSVDEYPTAGTTRPSEGPQREAVESPLESPRGRREQPESPQLASIVTSKDHESSSDEKPSLEDIRHRRSTSVSVRSVRPNTYTELSRMSPAKTYLQTLRPWSGRMSEAPWWRIAVRPFILYAYPSVLWSALVYALSVGWLIVISESVTDIYRDSSTYHFTALQAGLVYISPFIGGVLGTAIAGRVSDVIVHAMARRNEGIYEPEFRLVMVGPVVITTVVGLMGFGWSAQERDNWIVPTVFFGIISFGCALGSTTAIAYAVDCYRIYAGEALVTLNFAKNMHGLAFSLFFTGWLESDGSREAFVVIGAVQLACLFSTIPMYIFGKRARMWTVRKNLMERF